MTMQGLGIVGEAIFQVGFEDGIFRVGLHGMMV